MPSPQAALEEVPCNLCGAQDARTLYDRPYRLDAGVDCADFAATTDEFAAYGRIVRCRRCRLVYTNPRPNRDALLKGYGSCEDEAYLEEASSRSINAHLSLSTLRRFLKHGRLLEVGSSAGYFLNAARVDFEVAGLEPSAWACRVARERFRLDVHQGALLDPGPLEAGSFDALAMIDVIEHLADPKASLRRAASLLKPGGVLYLVTPDVGSLSARLLRGYWWGLRPAHIYYFDRRTLSRTLEEAGFEVLLTKSFGRIFTYAYWASRLRHYPPWIHRGVQAAIRALALEHKFLYLDTRDSVEVCARRRAQFPS